MRRQSARIVRWSQGSTSDGASSTPTSPRPSKGRTRASRLQATLMRAAGSSDCALATHAEATDARQAEERHESRDIKLAPGASRGVCRKQCHASFQPTPRLAPGAIPLLNSPPTHYPPPTSDLRCLAPLNKKP